jgi:hypothetical protein
LSKVSPGGGLAQRLALNSVAGDMAGWWKFCEGGGKPAVATYQRTS